MTEGKKPIQRILSWLLVFMMLSGLLAVTPAAAEASEPAELTETIEPVVGLTLAELMQKFPDGKYWNGDDPDGWTEKPCTHHGYCSQYGYNGWCGCNSFMGYSIQCMGFAEKLGYDATGYNPRLNENGWYTYKSTSALNNLKPGDIVRRNGHSMYVIAVDGDTVTIADCNSKDKSCNIRWGATVTKSNLKNNFEHVRSAPAELVIGYLGKCEDYPSSGSVTLKGDTMLKTDPCTAEVYEGSLDVALVSAGEVLTVTGVCLNTEGQFWYEICWQEANCYIPAEAVGDFFADFGSVTATNISAPKNTVKGSGFPIKASINSDTLSLTRVGAYVFEGMSVSAAPYMTSEDKPVNKYTYTVYGSIVDNNLTFGKLPKGNYTYLLTAEVTNYYILDGALVSDPLVIRLHQNTFTVSSSVSCSHSYTEKVTAAASCGGDGVITYTCKKCAFSYTQTVFATGEHSLEHSYGEWTVKKPASLSETGMRQKTCTECGDVVVEQIPCLAGDVDGWSMTLGADLLVNFQLSIDEDIRETAQVVITVEEDTYSYPVNSVRQQRGSETYRFTVPVAAAQMTDIISVQVVNGEDASQMMEYTVLQYAQAVLENDSLSDYHPLVREMLSYGAAAQIYFDHNTENLVDAGITGTCVQEVPEEWERPLSVNGIVEGIRFYGATLVYRDKIAVRYYFTVSGDIENYVFQSGDVMYTPVQKDNLWYVELPDILIQDLDVSITLTVNDSLSVTYCPMDYVVRMNQKGTDTAKALLKAMYNYHLVAQEYLETES